MSYVLNKGLGKVSGLSGTHREFGVCLSNDKMRAYLDEILSGYNQFDVDVEKNKSDQPEFYAQWKIQKQSFQSFYDKNYGHEWYSSFRSCADIMNDADPYYDSLDNFRAKLASLGGKVTSPTPPNPSEEQLKSLKSILPTPGSFLPTVPTWAKFIGYGLVGYVGYRLVRPVIMDVAAIRKKKES